MTAMLKSDEIVTSPIQIPVPAAFAQAAHVSGREAYDRLVAESQSDYEGYWAWHPQSCSPCWGQGSPAKSQW